MTRRIRRGALAGALLAAALLCLALAPAGWFAARDAALNGRVLTGCGLLDGARRLQSDPFPAPVYEAPADENLSTVRRLGDWLELEYSCFSRDRSEQTSFFYLVELKTGQVRRKPDLPELVWNGYGHQPTVYAQLQDRLLVDCRAEPYDYVEYGQDGAPYTIHSDRRYLGLITYEDYLNGTPDYTMLEAFN